MYTVTDSFHAACAAAGRQITIKAEFNGTTEIGAEMLKEIVLNDVFDTSDGIAIGSTCGSHVKIKMRQPDTPVALGGGYVIPYGGVMVAGGPVYVPLGKFYISEVTTPDDYRTVEMTAYDGMVKLERPYVPTIQFPATIANIAADICNQCGVTLDSSVVFPDYTISTLSTGSCKQQIGWIAGLMGKNAVFDRAGNLTFRWYADSALQVPRATQYLNGLERTTDANLYVLSLTTGTEDNIITVGSGQGISHTNPYMTQTIAETVFAQINGTMLTPCKLKWRGDPSVEVGDILGAVDKSGMSLPVFVMDQELHLSGGMYASVNSYGKSDAAIVMDKRPSDAKLEKMYAGLTAALQTATQKIIGSSGGYWRLTFDGSGELPTGWVIQDTPTVTPSTRMWIMSSGGLGYSVDGGTTITKVALTMDGAVNADCITTGQLSAERISVNGATLSDYLQISTDDDGHPVVRIGSSANAVVLQMQNDRIAFCDTNGAILAYMKNNEFQITNLSKFSIGNMAFVTQPNGSVSMV